MATASSKQGKGKQQEYQEEAGWGSLFYRPESKGTNQPMFTGQGLTPDGDEVQLAIWVRKAKSGQKYLRIHIEPPYEADEPAAEEEEDNNGFPF